ncbi:glutamine amidotransferase chain of NAD synthetase [Dehalogenimonas sp. WBC-2]|nr:glutamine amidotransferase chain of NAD synthetase [Dehalogenimonas sp. WBC-2]
MKQIRLALAQINPTVGDFEGNVRLIIEQITESKILGVDIIVFPELAITGYPPEDLLLKSSFIKANLKALSRVIDSTCDITAVVGFVDSQPEGIYNAAALVQSGKMVGVYHKTHLPNYGVFDEQRYFIQGNSCPVFQIAGVNIGINICEDIWKDNGPCTVQSKAGAEIILNISASPFHHGKHLVRERMLCARAVENATIVAFCNMVGGQDELVFDGSSEIFDSHGNLIARAKQFESELLIADLVIHDDTNRKNITSKKPLENGVEPEYTSSSRCQVMYPAVKNPIGSLMETNAEIYQALVVGTRDYIQKNGFEGVIIGLSGGIDSSIVATVAVDALGAEKVNGLIMPSRFSSTKSALYAEQLATNLRIKTFTISIEDSYQSYLDSLEGIFAGTKPDVTEENIQARIRGNFLMALSNKFGWLVLNTGNKSEVATGYTTLYGDMAGGFAVIKDVPKTMVYQLCKYRNSLAGIDLIPASVISRAPSAELRPEQKDSDSLPAYDLLDPILLAYIEEGRSVDEIIKLGNDPVVVRRVARLVDLSEYKRRQSPPGIKITPKAFGRDWRLPITNKFRDSGPL